MRLFESTRKIVMDNRIPIDDNDMSDYLIERIPDRALCNQARINCFTTKESLIDALDKITLREQSSTNSTQQEKRNVAPAKSTRDGKGTGGEKNKASGDKEKVDRKSDQLWVTGSRERSMPLKGTRPKMLLLRRAWAYRNEVSKEERNEE